MKNLVLTFLILPLLASPAGGETATVQAAWVGQGEPGGEVFLGRLTSRGWQVEKLPSAAATAPNYSPALARLSSGYRAVAWSAGSPPRILFSREGPGGWSVPVPVDPDCRQWQGFPTLAPDGRGNLWLAWARRSGPSTEIAAARIGPGGRTGPIEVSSPDAAPDTLPAVAATADGGALVAWQSEGKDRARIFRARLAPDGDLLFREPVEPSAEDQLLPAVAGAADGNRVSWFEGGRLVRAGKRGTRAIPAPSLSGVPWSDGDRAGWVLVCENGAWQAWRAQENWEVPPPRTPLPRGELSNLTFIGFGDSITYGHDSGEDLSRWYGPITAFLLQNFLPRLEAEFLNEGYPGATTYNMLYGGGPWGCPGVYGVIDLHPEAGSILIMGGTNDLGVFDSDDIAWYLGQIIDRSREKNVAPVISTIIPRCDHSGEFSQSGELSTVQIPELADLKACPLSDPYSLFMAFYPSDYFWYTLYSDDLVHPRWQQGDKLIADAWYDALLPLLPTPTPDASPTPSASPTPLEICSNCVDSADFNGDGSADVAVFRPSLGLWKVRGITSAYFGTSDDTPVPGDYDGDGTTDLAYFRAASGLWKVRGMTRTYFGGAGDKPIPGDYDGDLTCEMAYYRPSWGMWKVRGFTSAFFGQPGDVPVPGYYCSTADKQFGYFRPSSGLWKVRGVTSRYFGSGDEIPVPNLGAGDRGWMPGYYRASDGLWKNAAGTRFYFGVGGDNIAMASDPAGSGQNAATYRMTYGNFWKVKGVTSFYFGIGSDVPMAGRLTTNPSAAAPRL